MSFLNPLFLFGLAAAAVPILIHLLTRRRPREVSFSSLEFISEVHQTEIRRLKLKQWLLLLLRTLAVAALALAMARPALRGTAGLKTRAATTLVALVDLSGSMGAEGRSGTLAGEARRVIESLLSTLGPGDELLLVPYHRIPRPLTPRPISDLARLRAATQSLEASAHVTDHRLALSLAERVLGESRSLNRELFWVSDFQASGFAGADSGSGLSVRLGAWQQARVFLVPLAPANRANLAVSDANLAPAEQGAALSVTAAAFGAPAGDLAVEVRDAAQDAPLGRGFVALPDRGEGTSLVPLERMPETGGVVTIPDDALRLDNRRSFSAGRAGTLRILVREQGPPSALRLALEAGSPASGLMVESAAGTGLAARLATSDVLVLHDPDRLGPAELQSILDFHRGGGALLLVLGAHADEAFWNETLLRETGLGALGPVESAAPGASWRLRRALAGHPALAGFPSRPGEALSSAQFRAVRKFTPRQGRVVLEYDRAHPALVEGARALVLVASLDPESSDFAVSGAFLPLLHQCVKVLGRGTAASSLAPGERYSGPAATGAWRIEDEQGRLVPSELVTTSGATRLVSDPLERPGLYRVFQESTLRATFAVNPDARESDLSSLSESALLSAFPPGRAQIMRAGSDFARRVREARLGRELWSWFVTLALALLAAETILGRWGLPSAQRGDARG